jgi:DNA-binding NarL/FixJ family response regulator
MRNTVLIADDNAFVRTALYELFEREPDFTVCGLAENGREAIEEARRLDPDVIILDFSMPMMNGLEAARVLKQIMPAVILIMYSAACDEFPEHLAVSAGISGLISKSQKVSSLIETARGLVYQRAA